MTLVTGGRGQGKLDYVLTYTGMERERVAYTVQEARNAPIFDGVSDWIRASLQAGADPDKDLGALLKENPNVILIIDEVGCGVVPVDQEERLWREHVGRTACHLALQAETVVRILCGIPMVLKGEKH